MTQALKQSQPDPAGASTSTPPRVIPIQEISRSPKGQGSTPPQGGVPQSTEYVEALYAKRIEIYPRAQIGDTLGWFQRWRWALVWITQLVFYGLPWLTWNGRQAVLFDLASRKFYLFGLVLWPQDIIFLTGILIISALSLFLFTAIGGRLWCGYACPQTVYTEIFMWIERKIEGDRARRMSLDKSPWGARKVALKTAKHAAWIALALWTGYTFVGFFTPIRELGSDAIRVNTTGWESFWILFYGFATYGNAGWLREQVCKYMCPYARFQSAMFDKDTLIVTYDAERGEPRGKGTRDRAQRNLGNCVDCSLCVQVCPTGIDIRKGLQYECIGCGACIDACDWVMDKSELPRGLIRYATTNSVKDHFGSQTIFRRIFRPRVLVYGGILSGIVVALVVAMVIRVPLKMDVIRDRGAIAREVYDDKGRALVENVYRLQVMNTAEQRRTFTLSAEGIDDLELDSERQFEVAPASTVSVPLRLRAPATVAPGSHRIYVQVHALGEDDISVREKTTFLGLRR